MNLQQLMSLLPQQVPFRFVDQIICYQPGEWLEAVFLPERLHDSLGSQSFFPDTCLMEGLAQATVIFTQLETEPLRPGELPLLGSIETELVRPVAWDEQLTYQIRPIRMMQRRAILEGAVYGRVGQSEPGDLAAKAIIGVVISSSEMLQQEVRSGEAGDPCE
ncbi:hypothetical protein LOK74_07955 [Brevibacillus humidisoli]|uniref:hypothetical protein n=1 Tax=Brevibacillus humidisoli TaxID=2895522 RepID=UPI001E5DC16A|nr:hypothetical protein [Brevibacillus humidisoli]UFJ42408.1 hypothetical protein LOK74_07955 [Brevibacillus humidisoli]